MRARTASSRAHTHDLLVGEEYKLIEDAWEELGRRTYLHEEDASRAYVKGIARALGSAGWQTDPGKLRTFRHSHSQDEIELEPGGAEVTGHFLHHMRAMPEE